MTTSTAGKLLDRLRAQQSDMVDAVRALVEVESPSADLDAVSKAADATAAFGARVLGETAERVDVDGRPHLRWRFGGPTRVVLVGHFDTVWPMGTLGRWPFSIDGDVMTGPGVFDMKAGIVQGFHALAALEDIDGVAVVLNSDEEVGSLTSRALIEDTAKGATAALVLEPSAGGAHGALKVARKGVSMYDLAITGRAAHAGLEPEKGVNATVEMAHQALAIRELERFADGTTVTPTVASAGTTGNTVPASAALHIDVRARTMAELERVDAGVRASVASPRLEGAVVAVAGGINRPPLEERLSQDLFGRAQRLAGELAFPALSGVSVGGGSDGNFTAGIGTPTLDGLGAVGDHAHAEGEYALVSAMPERAALVAALVAQLLRQSS